MQYFEVDYKMCIHGSLKKGARGIRSVALLKETDINSDSHMK